MSLLCPEKSLSDTISDLKSAKEAEIAGAYAGTDIPVLDEVLKQLAKALAGLLVDSANSLISQGQQALANELTGLGNEVVATALGGLVAILGAGDEAQNALRAILVSNLSKQASLRLIQMRELQFHAKGIISVLQMLSTPYKNDRDPLLRQAQSYITNALKKLKKLRSMCSEAKPRFNMALYRSILADIDRAIDILTGTRKTSATQRFIKSINRNSNVGQVGQALSDYLWDTVLSEQVIRMETYIWHVTNFLAIVIPGVSSANLGVTKLVGGDNIPGLDPNRDTLLKRRKAALETARRQWKLDLPPGNSDLMKAFAWYDANKGLALTHDAAVMNADQILSFTADWSTLSAAASTLSTSMIPAVALLERVDGEVRTYIENNDGGESIGGRTNDALVTPFLFIPYIASELIATKELIKVFGKAGNGLEAVAQDNEIWAQIQAYLASPYYTNSMKSIDKLLKLIVERAALLAAVGPLNRRQLRQALIVFNEADKLLSIATSEEQRLLQLLQQFNIMDNPLVGMVMKNLAALAGSNPIAAGIVAGLTSGQMANVASMLSSAAAGLSTIGNFLMGCPSVKKGTAKTNPKVSAEVEIYNDRAKANVKAAEEEKKRKEPAILYYKAHPEENIRALNDEMAFT